jgi:hypothetical protein
LAWGEASSALLMQFLAAWLSLQARVQHSQQQQAQIRMALVDQGTVSVADRGLAW